MMIVTELCSMNLSIPHWLWERPAPAGEEYDWTFEDGLSTVERSRAAQVGEYAANLAEDKLKGARGKARDTVQDTRRRSSQKLEDEAKDIAGVRTGLELAVLDSAEAEGVELAGSCIATEQDRVREVHAEDGVHLVDKTVCLHTIDEALGNGLIVAVVPSAVLVLVSTEESWDGLNVGDVVLLAVGVELRQEGSISVQKKSGGSEEEVGVLLVLWTMLAWSTEDVYIWISYRLMPPLVTVAGKTGDVEHALGGLNHHAELGAVEAVVVALIEVVVVAAHGSISLEVVVAIEARLAAGDERDSGRAAGSIAANGELPRDDIAVSENESDQGDDIGQIPGHVEDVLRSVDHLLERGNTITSNEAVVGEHVHAGAAKANVSYAIDDN
jgi:hypothetical protein